MGSNTRAVIYCRISNDKAGAGLGVERQESDCRRLAERLNLDVVEVLTDNDISAYSGKRRPAYETLMQRIKAGAVDAVLAWHHDRLHRSPRDLEDYIDTVEAHSVDTHFATSGPVDLSTPTGRMTARQAGIFARYESEHKAERITAAHRQGAELGKYRGGSARPFGYKADGYTLEPTEAAAIRKAYQAIIEGHTIASIMRNWEAQGLRGTRGRKFSHVTFKNVLLRPRNYGASVYKGEIVGTGQWEPIVDEATWRAVHEILTDPGRKRSFSNQGKYLLGGIMRCGKCAETGRVSTVRSIGVRQAGKLVRYYRCSEFTHTNIKIVETDELITRLVLARITDMRGGIVGQPREQTEDKTAEMESEAKALRHRLTELVDMYASGEITRSQHSRAAESVKQRLGQLEALIASTGKNRPVSMLFSADDIEQAWENLVWSQKREIINALMTVTVLPVGRGYVRRYQPERIKVEWK